MKHLMMYAMSNTSVASAETIRKLGSGVKFLAPKLLSSLNVSEVMSLVKDPSMEWTKKQKQILIHKYLGETKVSVQKCSLFFCCCCCCFYDASVALFFFSAGSYWAKSWETFGQQWKGFPVVFSKRWYPGFWMMLKCWRTCQRV